MKMFTLDLETLGKGTDSIILSAAIVHFDLTETVTYQELLDRTLLVKFDVMEQKKMGRKINNDTLEWWKSKPKDVQKASLFPSKNDVSVIKGLTMIDDYVTEHGEPKKNICWTRGSLDQLLLDSLYTQVQKKPSLNYGQYMDLRTFFRLMKGSTDAYAYVDIPDFDKTQVKKHDPVHDVSYDVMGILFGT